MATRQERARAHLRIARELRKSWGGREPAGEGLRSIQDHEREAESLFPHGERNALAKLDGMIEAHGVWRGWEDETEPAEYDGQTYANPDELRERLEEEALSVEVRSAWHTPHEGKAESPAEFRVLLSWGGPACQITGNLSAHGEPENAWLEWQDWGTPWTPLRREWAEGKALLPEGATDSERREAHRTRSQANHDQSKTDEAAVLWFASLFYFGG